MTDAVDSAAPPPPAEPGYEAGEVVAGRFRLVRLLGEGGMGWVWVARDLQLDIDIAIKLIRNDVSVPAAAERLLTEARALARLEHPGIVHVTEFGRTEQNDPFIAMELLEGEDLGQVIEREERLLPVKALQLLLPVAEALGAAHARGIVHRDLKPDNVFLARDDGRTQPKLIDFGIAKLDLETKHTQAGVALGSPDYMAPEQARGQRDVDHRADIWAFCILIYETITGHVPFEDASYNAVLRHVIESPIPSIFEHGLDMPELWSILERGFEKDREQRWQSMRELGVALAGWLMDRGVTEDVVGASLRVVWLEPPRRSLLSLQEFQLGSGTLPRIDTASSIPPISEVGHESPAVSKRGKAALVGLVVFLSAVLALLVLTHRRVAAERAPAQQHPASRGGGMQGAAPAARAAVPTAKVAELPPPVTDSASARGAAPPASAAVVAPPPPTPRGISSRRPSARAHPEVRKPSVHAPVQNSPGKVAEPPAAATSAPKPPPAHEDLGF